MKPKLIFTTIKFSCKCLASKIGKKNFLIFTWKIPFNSSHFSLLSIKSYESNNKNGLNLFSAVLNICKMHKIQICIQSQIYH